MFLDLNIHVWFWFYGVEIKKRMQIFNFNNASFFILTLTFWLFFCALIFFLSVVMYISRCINVVRLMVTFTIVIMFKICDRNFQFSETVIIIQYYHFLRWALITLNFTLHLWIEDALVVSFTTLLLEQHSMQSAEANEGCFPPPIKRHAHNSLTASLETQ